MDIGPEMVNPKVQISPSPLFAELLKISYNDSPIRVLNQDFIL